MAHLILRVVKNIFFNILISVIMVKLSILLAGLILVIIQQFIEPLSLQLQFVIFLTGIVILGVPHGAADLLVATQNAKENNRKFSNINFFINYLGRLFIFAIVLKFFPLFGNVLFIFLAAYHFGETDLSGFKINTTLGKAVVINYGLLILGVILLIHYQEVKLLLMQFDEGRENITFINIIGVNRYNILFFLSISFVIFAFLFFNKSTPSRYSLVLFGLQSILILFLLYHLPMMLGFTYYFIIWHSLLSLRNIIRYLHKDGLFPNKIIIKQIVIYSFLAISGIITFGLTGIMYLNNNSMIIYIFLGLAVLTAPHMQIMHNMYNSMKLSSGSSK